jgi:predicted DNA-binding transcriptional regulator YafY
LKNLYNILKHLIVEQVSRVSVEKALDKRQRVRIYYDPTINRGPDEEEKIQKGYRNIEPYVLGLSKRGNPILRAYQINGVSDTDQAGWKTFRLDRITYWKEYPSFFFNAISDRDTTVPKYNNDGDELMTTIYKQVKFE